jgi:hypothetical protein
LSDCIFRSRKNRSICTIRTASCSKS